MLARIVCFPLNLNPALTYGSKSVPEIQMDFFIPKIFVSLFPPELKDFHEHRRLTFPDYTIYLCFGQCFSAAKPKESKLILVKVRKKKPL